MTIFIRATMVAGFATLLLACTPDSGQRAPPVLSGPSDAAAATTGQVADDALPKKPEISEGVAITAEESPQVQQGIPSKIPLPSKDVPTPILPPGAEISYVCESGIPLRIAFASSHAYVQWTDGTKLTLSIGAPGPGGGELYEGDGYVLRRIANVVELSAKGGGDRWRCAEESASV